MAGLFGVPVGAESTMVRTCGVLMRWSPRVEREAGPCCPYLPPAPPHPRTGGTAPVTARPVFEAISDRQGRRTRAKDQPGAFEANR